MDQSINVLGVKMSTMTMDETVKKLAEYLGDGKVHTVYTPNSEIIYMAYKDDEFKKVLNSADIKTPDGIGAVYASKILKKPLSERVAGYDLMHAFLKYAAQKGARVFLFGSKPGVAENAGKMLCEKYSGLVICGTRDGYFKDEQTDEIINMINDSNPDIVLVCLGAPKQEKWIYTNKDKINKGIMMGLGGSLDTLTGVTQRAPEIWQKLGLEWAYRLVKEPTRIGRMMALPRFGLTVLFKGKRYKGE